MSRMLLDLDPSRIPEMARRGKLTLCIVGLGAMGLPTACLFANAGVRVIGADKDPYVVETVNRRRSHVPEPELGSLVKKCVESGLLKATDDVPEAVRQSQVVMVIVPTSVTEGKQSDYSRLQLACEEIGKGLQRGSLIIVESTVAPGVTRSVVLPALEGASDLKAGPDFGLAYSPIRAAVGRALRDIPRYARLVGAIDEKSLELAAAFLSIVVRGRIIKVSSLEVAEASKLFENVYRDVNIALANQLAELCEALGIDFDECLRAANTQPHCRLHRPSSGVGGPCIPVNPYFLLEKAKQARLRLSLVQEARRINERVPQRIARLMVQALRARRKVLCRSKVAVLGISFKANVKDVRRSHVLDVVRLLEHRGIETIVYDPHYSAEELSRLGLRSVDSFREAAKQADGILIAIGHRAFKELNLEFIAKLVRKPAVLMDCERILDCEGVRSVGLAYVGVGRG